MKVDLNRLTAACVVAGSMALLVGCATPGPQHAYPGETRPVEQLALVVGSTNAAYQIINPAGERISFTEVDGDSTVPWYSLSPYPTSIRVLPGRRELGVQYEHIHGVARGAVFVNAMSNRTYQVKVLNPDKRTERVFFVIEDITAQTLVGGGEDEVSVPAAPAPEATPAQP